MDPFQDVLEFEKRVNEDPVLKKNVMRLVTDKVNFGNNAHNWMDVCYQKYGRELRKHSVGYEFTEATLMGMLAEKWSSEKAFTFDTENYILNKEHDYSDAFIKGILNHQNSSLTEESLFESRKEFRGVKPSTPGSHQEQKQVAKTIRWNKAAERKSNKGSRHKYGSKFDTSD